MATFVSNAASRIYVPQPIHYNAFSKLDLLFEEICMQSEEVARDTIISFIESYPNSQMLTNDLSKWLQQEKSHLFCKFSAEQILHYFPRLRLFKTLAMSDEFVVTQLKNDKEYLQCQLIDAVSLLKTVDSFDEAMVIMKRSLEKCSLSPKQTMSFIFSAFGKSWGKEKFQNVIKHKLSLPEVPQDAFYLLFMLAAIEQDLLGLHEGLQAPLRQAGIEVPDEIWRSPFVNELMKKSLLKLIGKPFVPSNDLRNVLVAEESMLQKIVECHPDLTCIAKEYALKRFAHAFVNLHTSDEDLDQAFAIFQSLNTTELRPEYSENLVRFLFGNRNAFSNPERTARYFPLALNEVEKETIIQQIARARLSEGIHCYFFCLPIQEQTQDYYRELLFKHAIVSFNLGDLCPMRNLTIDWTFENWAIQVQAEDLKCLYKLSKIQFLNWKLSLEIFEKMGPNAFQGRNLKEIASSIVANGLSSENKKLFDLRCKDKLNLRDWIKFTGVIFGIVEPFKFAVETSSDAACKTLCLLLEKIIFFPNKKEELEQFRLAFQWGEMGLKLKPFFDHIEQIFIANQLSVKHIDVFIQHLEEILVAQGEKIHPSLLSHYLKSQMVEQYKEVLRENMKSLATKLDRVEILQ